MCVCPRIKLSAGTRKLLCVHGIFRFSDWTSQLLLVHKKFEISISITSVDKAVTYL